MSRVLVIALLALGIGCATDASESDFEYSAGGRYLMPKYGCAYLDLNRRYMKDALAEVTRLHPEVVIGAKPLGAVVLLLKGVVDKTGEVAFAIEMVSRVSSLEVLCVGQK